MGSTGVPFTSGTGRQPVNSNVSRRPRAIRNLLNPARLFRGVRQPLRQLGSTPATVEHDVDNGNQSTQAKDTRGRNVICSTNETFCPTCQRIVLTTEFPRCHQRVLKRPVASTTAEPTVTEPEPTPTTVPQNTTANHSPSDNGTECEDEATLCSFCYTCNKIVLHQTKENGSCHGPCVF